MSLRLILFISSSFSFLPLYFPKKYPPIKPRKKTDTIHKINIIIIFIFIPRSKIIIMVRVGIHTLHTQADSPYANNLSQYVLYVSFSSVYLFRHLTIINSHFLKIKRLFLTLISTLLLQMIIVMLFSKNLFP